MSLNATENLEKTIKIFPYAQIRPDQVKFSRFVHNNPYCMIHAPTGFGKTSVALASLLPYIKSDINPHGHQLIIFTRTKTQIFQSYFRDFNRIIQNRQFGFFRVLPLISKAEYCLHNHDLPHYFKYQCGALHCPEAKRAKQIEEDDLEIIIEQFPIGEEFINPEEFKNVLKDFGCPYFVLKRCLPFVSCIITTHAYLQSPSLRGYLLKKIANPIILVDEAHNFSYHTVATITSQDLSKALELGEFATVQSLIDMMKGKPGKIETPEVKDKAILLEFLTQADVLQDAHHYSIFYKIAHFLEGDTKLWINTGDALERIDPYPDWIFASLKKHANRILLMSGSFEPTDSYLRYYQLRQFNHLSMQSSYTKRFDSIYCDPKVTTSYKRRMVMSKNKIAYLIERLHALNPHHTACFTTSHTLKSELNDMLQTKFEERPNGKLAWQQRQLPYLDHELILGVLGGRLSEGIEILDPKTGQSKITMVIIIGLPYPPPDEKMKVLQDLYIHRYGRRKDREFLVELPMKRVLLQAIGRGLRSKNDYCASVILDYRAAKIKLLRSSKLYTKEEALYSDLKFFYSRYVPGGRT